MSTQILIHIKGTVKCVYFIFRIRIYLQLRINYFFPLGRYGCFLTTALMESENSKTSLQEFLRHSRRICLSHVRHILSSGLCLVIHFSCIQNFQQCFHAQTYSYMVINWCVMQKEKNMEYKQKKKMKSKRISHMIVSRLVRANYARVHKRRQKKEQTHTLRNPVFFV